LKGTGGAKTKATKNQEQSRKDVLRGKQKEISFAPPLPKPQTPSPRKRASPRKTKGTVHASHHCRPSVSRSSQVTKPLGKAVVVPPRAPPPRRRMPQFPRIRTNHRNERLTLRSLGHESHFEG
jgi:hypothetical protein